MKLAELFSIYPYPKWGESAQKEVSRVCSDSRVVEPNDVFVSIRGRRFDGHSALSEVCQKKVVAVVVEDESQVPASYEGAILKVQDTAVAVNELSHHFFKRPSEKMFCVGITGTNGKSSITYLVEKIFADFGWKTGVIGTIDHHLQDKKWETNLTTPDPISLHRRISDFHALKAKALVMEVSSIALEQKRIRSVHFDSVVFTNLTRDHLDYHSTMENYFQCKQILFSDLVVQSIKRPTFAIVNGDDEFGRQMNTSAASQTWFYGQAENCDLQFKILKQSFSGSYVEVSTPNGKGEFLFPMVGRHNVYNAMAALGVAMGAGVSLEKSLSSLSSFRGVPGRLEKIENERDVNVFVDYAHTDDALKNVLQVAYEIRNEMRDVVENENEQKRKPQIITVFGCGGDRDRGKRALMAQAAEKFSDQIFVTSDNPRTEEPEQIIDDIMLGFSKKTNVFRFVDRKEAIEKALQASHTGDAVIIAGKGHEDYQIIGEEKRRFSDQEVVREFLGSF